MAAALEDQTVINLSDVPRLLLTIAVRRMPAERSEWGEAMLAELAQLEIRPHGGGLLWAASVWRCFPRAKSD